MQTTSTLQVLPAITDNATFYLAMSSKTAGLVNSTLVNPGLSFNPSSNVLTVNTLQFSDGTSISSTVGIGSSTTAAVVNNPVINGGVLTLNYAQSSVFNVSMTSSINGININNPAAAGYTTSFVLIFNYVGTAYSVIWPSSVRWVNGAAPTLTGTNGKRDIFSFISIDGGVSYDAFVTGLNV